MDPNHLITLLSSLLLPHREYCRHIPYAYESRLWLAADKNDPKQSLEEKQDEAEVSVFESIRVDLSRTVQRRPASLFMYIIFFFFFSVFYVLSRTCNS